MLSFHNNPAIKQKYTARLAAHAGADELIQGQYWERGKGCAVGCTLHSSDHAAYEDELGIPEWLGRVEDSLFEGLPSMDAKKFAVEFLEAIPVGIDLQPLKGQFSVFLLQENIKYVLTLPLTENLKEQVINAIHAVLKLHKKAVQTGADLSESARASAWSSAKAAAGAAAEAAAEATSWSAIKSPAWLIARSAEASAWSSAWAAESAAWAAIWSAESVAKSVWSSAWASAWAAESARSAEPAARAAAYKRYAAKLLRLLKAAGTRGKEEKGRNK